MLNRRRGFFQDKTNAGWVHIFADLAAVLTSCRGVEGLPGEVLLQCHHLLFTGSDGSLSDVSPAGDYFSGADSMASLQGREVNS